jgi:plasmid stability protein
MGTMTIRGLDDDLKKRLRLRAAENGRSMETELREILRAALAAPADAPFDLGARIHRRFAEVGGVDLPEVERGAPRKVPDFSSRPD